jgi:hypothetical protein
VYADLIDQSEEALRPGHGGHRDVGEHRAEANGDEQEGLEATGDAEIEQQKAHPHHHQLAPLEIGEPG